MFLDIVDHVKKNVEISIKRLGQDGIEILNLVIPKPEIPADIAKNYKQVKVQWTEQLVATQQQKTERIKKETQLIKVMIKALQICKFVVCLRLLPMLRGRKQFWRSQSRRGLLRRREQRMFLSLTMRSRKRLKIMRQIFSSTSCKR